MINIQNNYISVIPIIKSAVGNDNANNMRV